MNSYRFEFEGRITLTSLDARKTVTCRQSSHCTNGQVSEFIEQSHLISLRSLESALEAIFRHEFNDLASCMRGRAHAIEPKGSMGGHVPPLGGGSDMPPSETTGKRSGRREG